MKHYTKNSRPFKCQFTIKPLTNLMQLHIRSYDIAFADETWVQLLDEPGRKPESQSYICVFVGGQPK